MSEPPPPRRRVVILSPGGEFTSDVLALLEKRGARADALLLYLPSALRPWRAASGARRLAAAAMVPVRWLGWRLRRRIRGAPRGGAARVVFTGTLDGAWMLRDLRRLRPDVMVLATCSLLKPPVLEIPREGTLNVHPGLLPWVRGNSPFGNALLRGVPLGCTTFWVDEGIDTGPMLDRRLLAIAPDATVPDLRDRLYALWVEMTADAVQAAAAGSPLPRAPYPRRFPLGRTLPPGRADQAAADGRARTLFERWRPFCDAGERLAPGAEERVAAAFPEAGTPPAAEREESGLHG